MGFRNQAARPDLDEQDLKILQQLSQDAKTSYVQLGQLVGLTGPAVHGRVRKMEKGGVIRRYGIEVDYSVIGLPVTAFVRVQTGKTSCRDAGRLVSKYEEVIECHTVAGEDDLLLKTRTATPLDLQNLLDKLKTEGLIEKSISVFVLETQFERVRI
ncbi:MAG: Lrp/AsnC family transcriptional regulator [Steroidobacteraceae bacterium]